MRPSPTLSTCSALLFRFSDHDADGEWRIEKCLLGGRVRNRHVLQLKQGDPRDDAATPEAPSASS